MELQGTCHFAALSRWHGNVEVAAAGPFGVSPNLKLMLMYKLQLHKCLAVQIIKPDMINETKKF